MQYSIIKSLKNTSLFMEFLYYSSLRNTAKNSEQKIDTYVLKGHCHFPNLDYYTKLLAVL